MIYLISMCVWECMPESVLRTPASDCALNFWWILNISGSDKVKEKEKKNRFDTIAYERHDPWHTGINIMDKIFYVLREMFIFLKEHEGQHTARGPHPALVDQFL